MTCKEIDNRFKYHEPNSDQLLRYLALRTIGRELAYAILNYCPESREKSTALTRLDECIMHANAAIARHEDPKPVPLTVKSSIDSFNELRRSPAGTKIPHDWPEGNYCVKCRKDIGDQMFDVCSSCSVKEEAKLRAKISMRATMPLLIQFLVSEQARLEKEGKKINIDGFLSLFDETFGLDTAPAQKVEKPVQGPQEHAVNDLKVDKTKSGFCIRKPEGLSETGVATETPDEEDDDPYSEVGGSD